MLKMNVGVYPYPHGDPLLIDKIVNEFLSQGKFDKLRKECMSDADTKPAYQNLQQRVENTVAQFLKKQVWRPDLNKNQLRDSLRKHILESKFFDAGINRIVDQVVNPNVLAAVFLPEVEEVVYNYLSIPRPFDKNQKRDERVRASGNDHKTSHESQKYGREGGEVHRRENHSLDEDYKSKELFENETIKMEPQQESRRMEEKIKSEPEEELQIEKAEVPSDESQESLNRMAVEGLHINEEEVPPLPDSDDSAPLEINEKSMSESRDSEDSIMNQMSPISQGRLTPDLEEELPEVKVEGKPPEGAVEGEKKPLTFIGRIPKIKREDSESSKSSKTKEDATKKEKLEVKNVYSSDESDSSKSYGKSDSEGKKMKNDKSNKEERKREEEAEKKHKERKKESSRERKSSKERHKDHKRERSRERHKKSSTSSSSSQRERSSSHHKSSHRHKDSKSRRKEEEKKKNKSTDDHGRERNKKEDRRSTDRDSNERERGRSSGSRTDADSRKREKEQPKTEEVKGENTQKEECVEEETVKTERREKEEDRKTPEGKQTKGGEDFLDFQKLFQMGALSRLEFPKLTDDFYVKFNSTGFRYFEEWEKSKLDCEEEFKEFVDEAENDLSLISDDESDFEMEKNFGEENKRTIENLLKGLGNFRRCVMFDPNTSEFYKWTNSKFYQKARKKGETRERSTEKTESDESIKENIDRGGEKRRALHLKLINKYRRKAMRMGKPRRRQRRHGWGGIKEKNEIEFFNKGTEKFLGRVIMVPDCSLVESETSTVPTGVNSLNNLYRSEGVSLPESPEESEDWKEKTNETGKMSESLQLHLPPSPDSDDINTNSGPNNATVQRKRVSKSEGGTPKKQTRRNYSQKYESQDLYKPRPILNGSRTRGRGLERELVDSGSPVLR